MKVNRIALWTADKEVVDFPFSPRTDRQAYTAREVIGLDANEIVPKFYGRNANTRARYYLPTIGKREIVIKISLNAKLDVWETYSGLRDVLYKGIASTQDGKMELRFMAGPSVIAKLDGFVTKFEAPLSSAVPDVTMTISCDDGILRSMEPIIKDNYDNSAIGQLKLIIADNDSTAPHGLTFEVQFTDTVVTPFFSIQNKSEPAPDWFFRIAPGIIAGGPNGFANGDRLFFTNEGAEKSVFMIRGSTTYYLADRIVAGSIWPVVYPGTNTWVINRSTGTYQWNAISYRTAYWGV